MVVKIDSTHKANDNEPQSMMFAWGSRSTGAHKCCLDFRMFQYAVTELSTLQTNWFSVRNVSWKRSRCERSPDHLVKFPNIGLIIAKTFESTLYLPCTLLMH